MNVLITTGIFPPDIGGPANYVPRIAEWLTQHGHSTEVICWSDNALDHETRSYPVTRIARSMSVTKRVAGTVETIREKARRADVVFANGLPFLTRCAAALARKPVVHKVVGDSAWERASLRGWYAGTLDDYQLADKRMRLRLLDWVRNASYRSAARIITPSNYLAAIVRGWGIDQHLVQTIYNSTAVHAPSGELVLPRHDGYTIVTVCRLVPWKGVDRIISLLPGFQHARLIVAGGGPMKAELLQLAQRHHVSDRVIFLGQLPELQVGSLLRQADIFVLNSSYEGLPHVVLEAMASGTPVVATDVGGTAEAVTHRETGLLIPFADEEALREALRELLGSPSLRASLASRARAQISAQFSEEICFAETVSILEAVAREAA